MDDGTVAAFKLLYLQNEEASKSFSKECRVLSEVGHRNLVKIISLCLEFRHKVLVLDFMSNGNLETLLHSKDNSLTFREILDIAIDVIHELEYLHHGCFLQVVHCDIKPSNILMDEDMTTHVADFGITEIINRSDTLIVSGTTSTLALKGSMGYIAPDYGVGGKVSTRSDIYSYGIMLLEMITSKSPTHHMFVGGLNLHKWVNMHFHTNLDEIVGKRTMEEIGEYEVNECLIPLLLVGLVCSKESASERPTAREVAGVLKTIRETLLEPH